LSRHVVVTVLLRPVVPMLESMGSSLAMHEKDFVSVKDVHEAV
jgi:hypothetical protein